MTEVFIYPGDVVKEGWLMKQSRVMKVWRRRRTVLTAHHLYTFRKQGEYRTPTEAIHFCECSTVKSAEEESIKQNSFCVGAKERVFYFSADSAQDKEAWIRHIGSMGVIAGLPNLGRNHQNLMGPRVSIRCFERVCGRAGTVSCGQLNEACRGPQNLIPVRLENSVDETIELSVLGIAGDIVWGPAHIRSDTSVKDLMAVVSSSMRAPVQLMLGDEILPPAASLFQASLSSGDILTALVDLRGWNLLTASRDGQLQLIDLFLESGEVVNQTDEGAWTALMFASDAGHLDVVNRLLEWRADVNVRSGKGNTALIMSCRGGHPNIASLLLRARAEIHHRVEGVSALNYATSRGLCNIIDLLTE